MQEKEINSFCRAVPMCSYAHTVVDTIVKDLRDPDTQVVFMTIFRMSVNSTICKELIRAAKRGVHINLFVETAASHAEKHNENLAKYFRTYGMYVVTDYKKKVHFKAFMALKSRIPDGANYSEIEYDPDSGNIYNNLYQDGHSTSVKAYRDIFSNKMSAIIGKYYYCVADNAVTCMVSTGNFDGVGVANSEDIVIYHNTRGSYHEVRPIRQVYEEFMKILIPKKAWKTSFYSENTAKENRNLFVDRVMSNQIYNYKVKAQGTTNIYFGADAVATLVSAIRNAHDKISIKAPIVTRSSAIANALEEAVIRGVNVQIVSKKRVDTSFLYRGFMQYINNASANYEVGSEDNNQIGPTIDIRACVDMNANDHSRMIVIDDIQAYYMTFNCDGMDREDMVIEVPRMSHYWTIDIKSEFCPAAQYFNLMFDSAKWSLNPVMNEWEVNGTSFIVPSVLVKHK